MWKDLLKTKRFFVPENIQIDFWEAIEPLFQNLLNESLYSKQALKAWQAKVKELKTVLHQEKTIRYIEMTCHVDDPQRGKRYQDFIRGIEPRYKAGFQQLNAKLRASSCGEAHFSKKAQRSKKIQQNMLSLKSEENELKAAYQKIVGSITLKYKESNLTLYQVKKILSIADRKIRKEIWELQANQWIRLQDDIKSIFTKLIQVRTQLAVQAGFANYRDYIFHAYKRVDYGPEDCVSFHRLCAKRIVPLLKKMQAKKQKKLGLTMLKPFDLSYDEDGIPLCPFENTGELLEKMQQLFFALDYNLGTWFQRLIQHNLLDLENRKGKAPGSYCVNLEESKLPFIFMNATGSNQDIITLLHESGHAFHYLAMLDVNEQKIPPREMSELVAIGMEILGISYIKNFYPKTESRLHRKKYFQNLLSSFAEMALIDSFEHWIYTHEHSSKERNTYWLKLSKIYQGSVDYSLYNNIIETSYYSLSLLFEAPFYFIEYAFARIGALQLLCNFQKNKEGCIKKYLHSLSLGGKLSLPELYQAAGVKFGFEEKNIIDSLYNLEQEIFQKDYF